MTVYRLYQACQSIKQNISRAFYVTEESHKEYLARLSRKDKEKRERLALHSPNIIDRVVDSLFKIDDDFPREAA